MVATHPNTRGKVEALRMAEEGSSSASYPQSCCTGILLRVLKQRTSLGDAPITLDADECAELTS